MASYSSSGVQVSWNDRALPGMGGVSAPAASPAWFVVRCAIVSRVALTPGLFMSGVSALRAVVSLWAWRAWSSPVSM